MRMAKIICTIGPASRDEDTLRKLIENGMNVARINFSHGTRQKHREVFERVRRLSDQVAVMQDLRGPKIRVGEIEEGEMCLTDGELITLTTRSTSGEGRFVQVTYPDLPKDVSRGDSIYLADGIIHLEVEGVEGEDVHCRIVHGGVLTSHKGVNIPGVCISVPALTDRDRDDLEFGLELGVDYVALSFVRSAEEVEVVKRLIIASGSSAGVVAKIEKQEALDELDEIIEAADVLMIARGDLAVETSTEEVPVVQKQIIARCLEKGKPVITATQMLESMVHSERPTRAEASDVANAVIDGTDALMLSAETAVGRYPVGSVAIMDRIIRRAEDYGGHHRAAGHREGLYMREVSLGRGGGSDKDVISEAACIGAVKVADEIGASALVCLTHSGRTAMMIAVHRPRVPILALTDFLPVVRRMAPVWGVVAIPIESIESTEKIFTVITTKVKEAGHRGKVVLTAGIPTKERGPTNTVHIVDV